MIRGPKVSPVCWEEMRALHVCFFHLTNTSHCLKDGHVLECSFCFQDTKCASCLKCSDKCRFNVVTPVVLQLLCFNKVVPIEKGQSRYRCFFYRSVPFYHACDKCPRCCRRYSCRGPTAKKWQVLATKGLSPRVVLILKERYSLY